MNNKVKGFIGLFVIIYFFQFYIFMMCVDRNVERSELLILLEGTGFIIAIVLLTMGVISKTIEDIKEIREQFKNLNDKDV